MKKATIIAVVIAVCLSGMAYANGQSESSSAANAAQKQVSLRFSWWGGDARHKATLAALSLYSEKFPNVKIEGEYGQFSSYYQKLLTQLSGGTAPDVFQVDFKWVHDLLSQNPKWFVNMNTMSDKIDMSGLDMKFARDWGAVNGYLIGLPLGMNGIGLVYNKDLIRQAGIDINNSWTWDDLLAAGAKMKQYDPSKYALFFNKDYFTYMFKVQMKQRSGYDLIKSDYTLGFNREDAVATFQYLRKLLDTGTIPPLEETVPFEKVYADQTPNWLNQKYAICPTSSSVIPRIRAASQFPLGVARYPVLKGAKNPGLITAPTMLISLNASSPNLAEATKFANWFLNDKDAIMTLGDTRGLPAVKNARELLLAADKLDQNIKDMVEAALPFSGGPEDAQTQNQEVVVIIEDYIQQVGYGKMTPAQAADGLMKDLKEKVAEMKSRA